MHHLRSVEPLSNLSYSFVVAITYTILVHLRTYLKKRLKKKKNDSSNESYFMDSRITFRSTSDMLWIVIVCVIDRLKSESQIHDHFEHYRLTVFCACKKKKKKTQILTFLFDFFGNNRDDSLKDIHVPFTSTEVQLHRRTKRNTPWVTYILHNAN